jgi:hypothetical protein
MLAAPAADDALEPEPVCCRDVLRAEPGLPLGLLVPLDMSELWLQLLLGMPLVWSACASLS